MAVDSLRETFHINRVKPEELTLSLIAQSYRPEITAAVSKIKARPDSLSLQAVCREPIRQGQSPVYAAEGYPCLKTRNILDTIVSCDEVDYADPSTLPNYISFLVDNQNILITRSGAGSIGRASIYFGLNRPLINEHLFKVVIADGYDPAYICCFLRSWWGERALEQGITGSTGQLNLSNDHIRSLPIAIPDLKVQKYIGNKVRQAERLEDSSKHLIIAFLRLVEYITQGKLALDKLPLVSNSKDSVEKITEQIASSSINAEALYNSNQRQLKKHSRVDSRMIGDRIDAWYYKDEFLQIVETLNTWKQAGIDAISLGSIASVEYGFMPTEDYWPENQGAPLLRVTNIKENLVIDLSKVEFVNPVLSLKERYMLSAGDVLIVQCGNSTGRIAYVTDSLSGWVFPSFCLRVRCHSLDWNPAFLAAFLSSGLGQLQIQQTISITSVRLNTTKPAIESIQLPKFPSIVQDYIGVHVHKAIVKKEFVECLIKASKLLVEALIEGQITETELREAQEALERGDSDADREILSRLTTKGYGVDAPPLFPDLDALYDAISQTTDSKEEQ